MDHYKVFMMEFLVVFLYLVALLYIFLFSLSQLQLTWYYRKRQQKTLKLSTDPHIDLPKVTVQLPIYNEKYVVERLLEAVCSFDYPNEKLEIQILDDSTDETTEIVAKKLAVLQQKNINIVHLVRNHRKGFKAGSLQYGLERASGDLLAIFDADFLPEPGFLKDTVPALSDPQVGMVQTRWGHLNKEYSLLTRLQAFGLDAHFSIEQSGRSAAGSLINFNGTAGVWKKECVIDAGGWSADTLTEDLDLSYRAQMRGWKFKYLEEIVSPAELPVLMPAVKSQQFRWNKGAAETARKNFWKIIKAPWSWTRKTHAFFHLFNSSVFLFLLIAALLSIPMLFLKNIHPELNLVFNAGSVFLIGFFSIAYFYWVANKQTNPEKSFRYYMKTFPSFLTVSMGLSLHNSIAFIEGLFGFKSPFIRTPKFDIRYSKDRLRKNVYINHRLSISTILEGILSLYFIFGIIAGIYLGDWALLIFHLMLALGFATVFYQSVKPVRYAA